ncbi:MAG: Hsp70 family protein [Candidatus Hodgkinia cicadicola]
MRFTWNSNNPKRCTSIKTSFDIDANGIVQTSANDKGIGKEQQVKIKASGGLSDIDIKTMIDET